MSLRDELARLGELSDDDFVERGLIVARDVVIKALREIGVDSAASFEMTLKNGGVFTITSDSSPHLNTPVGEIASMTPRQSGKAGVTGS